MLPLMYSLAEFEQQVQVWVNRNPIGLEFVIRDATSIRTIWWREHNKDAYCLYGTMHDW